VQLSSVFCLQRDHIESACSIQPHHYHYEREAAKRQKGRNERKRYCSGNGGSWPSSPRRAGAALWCLVSVELSQCYFLLLLQLSTPLLPTYSPPPRSVTEAVDSRSSNGYWELYSVQQSVSHPHPVSTLFHSYQVEPSLWAGRVPPHPQPSWNKNW